MIPSRCARRQRRRARRISEALLAVDPGNIVWQRDLSVTYGGLGDVKKAQGDLAGALKSYRDGLSIIERLAQSDQ